MINKSIQKSVLNFKKKLINFYDIFCAQQDPGKSVELFIKFNSKDREIEHGRFNFAMHLYLKPQAYIFL